MRVSGLCVSYGVKLYMARGSIPSSLTFDFSQQTLGPTTASVTKRACSAHDQTLSCVTSVGVQNSLKSFEHRVQNRDDSPINFSLFQTPGLISAKNTNFSLFKSPSSENNYTDTLGYGIVTAAAVLDASACMNVLIYR